ncbi:hypothetical protein LINPERPRIM_LOCUS35538 [Linum perenne]
MFTSSLV